MPPLMHGSYEEDGRLQGFLDMIGVPYVFSGTLASTLAMDKSKIKILAKFIDVKVLPEILAQKQDKFTDIFKKFSKLVVVKPVQLGLSVGISIVKTDK